MVILERFSWATWELIKGNVRAEDEKIAGLCRKWRPKIYNVGSVWLRRNMEGSKSVAYRGGEFGVFKPPPEILKALQNRAKLNPIVKTVKNC